MSVLRLPPNSFPQRISANIRPSGAHCRTTPRPHCPHPNQEPPGPANYLAPPAYSAVSPYRRPYLRPHRARVHFVAPVWTGWIGLGFLGYPDTTGYCDFSSPTQLCRAVRVATTRRESARGFQFIPGTSSGSRPKTCKAVEKKGEEDSREHHREYAADYFHPSVLHLLQLSSANFLLCGSGDPVVQHPYGYLNFEPLVMVASDSEMSVLHDEAAFLVSWRERRWLVGE
jgi:hypothetical protein